MDPTALVLIFVELLNKVEQQKIFNINITLFASGRKRFNFHMYMHINVTVTTDSVTVLRQSHSIVPVSAWLTESKPSCFSRVFYYCREKRREISALFSIHQEICFPDQGAGKIISKSGDLRDLHLVDES